MVRKTTASANGVRRKRRLPPQQMDLFSRGAAASAPNWLDLPKDAREALIGLMTRLILAHAQTTTMEAGHDR
jgi:hypothetical protein